MKLCGKRYKDNLDLVCILPWGHVREALKRHKIIIHATSTIYFYDEEDVRKESEYMMKDQLYEKYRVFKEPQNVPTHPANVHTYYEQSGMLEGDEMMTLEEVRDFVFVLKPDTDEFAKIALKVYAELVMKEYPQLGQDLRLALASL